MQVLVIDVHGHADDMKCTWAGVEYRLRDINSKCLEFGSKAGGPRCQRPSAPARPARVPVYSLQVHKYASWHTHNVRRRLPRQGLGRCMSRTLPACANLNAMLYIVRTKPIRLLLPCALERTENSCLGCDNNEYKAFPGTNPHTTRRHWPQSATIAWYGSYQDPSEGRQLTQPMASMLPRKVHHKGASVTRMEKKSSSIYPDSLESDFEFQRRWVVGRMPAYLRLLPFH